MLTPRTNGFTLIELLVVLGIVGLLLTVVPPLFSHSLDSVKLKSATRELAAALKSTRNKAIDSQKDAVLALDVVTGIYHVGEHHRTLTLPDNAHLELTTAKSEQHSDSKGTVRFFADGSATGGEIVLRGEKTAYHIDIHWLTGQIQITP